jgi:pyridoxine kinase
MAILSLQSSVVRGHVGNSAALPILHRMGCDVWPINTVTFSNHPAHGAFTGRIAPPSEIADLITGLTSAFDQCDAVLSGYLGRADTGPVVLDAVAAVKQRRPNALYCCDPVIGDNGASYVAEGVAEFFRDHAIPAADIVTPNVFEAEWLSGRAIETPDSAVQAARALLSLGPSIALVTGIQSGGDLATIAVNQDNAWVVATPALDIPGHGAGDAFAALFLGHYLQDRDLPTALSRAASGLYAVLRATQSAGAGGDLHLIPALDEMIAPPKFFRAERLG